MTTKSFTIPTLAMLSVLALSGCNTAPKEAPPEELIIDDTPPPEASALLDSFCDAMRNLSTFRVVVHTWEDDVSPTAGMKLQFEKSIGLDVQRPDSMRVESVSDARHTVLWRNAESATILDTDLNLYSMLNYRGDIDSFVDHVAETYGLEMPLADILVSNPCEGFEGILSDATYIGVSLVRGKSCHHLALSGDQIDFQLWLPVDGPAYPVKMSIDYKTLESRPQYTALFGDFKTSVDPEALLVSLPEDAEKIEMIRINAVEGAAQ